MGNFKNICKLNRNVNTNQVITSIITELNYKLSQNVILNKLDKASYDKHILNSTHCTYSNFNETDWNGMSFTMADLIKLANTNYNKSDIYWREVLSRMEH